MKTQFACTVALITLFAAGTVQASPAFDLDGDELGFTEVMPVEMDMVRRADGTLTTRETYLQEDGTTVTRTTVRKPIAAHPVEPVGSVELTAAQRRLIWHTVAVPMSRADSALPPEVAEARQPVREHIEAVPGPRPYRVGSHIPVSSSLQPLPDAVTLAVPSVQDHLYAMDGERVLLVDPATNTVVAEVVR
jgi:hypothetical protein